MREFEKVYNRSEDIRFYLQLLKINLTVGTKMVNCFL